MKKDRQNHPLPVASLTSPNSDQSPLPYINQEEELQEGQEIQAILANIAFRPDDEFVDEVVDEVHDSIDDQAYFEKLPPGYRFAPMDSELIVHYLRKTIAKEVPPRNQIRHLNLYSDSPKNISEKYPPIGDKEWYFFTPRVRKYRNGSRPNRAAGSGFWRPNGADKNIKCNGAVVGYKKALAFYEGKPKKSVKTSWIMHEFRVNGPSKKKSNNDDMRLDDFVLCRIYNRSDKTYKIRPRIEDPEDADQNGYPPQQGNERFDHDNGYFSEMENKNDLGGINRELNANEASAGYIQSQFQNGFPENPRMVDPASLANSANAFNDNFQLPLNYVAGAAYFRPKYPAENAFMTRYMKEGPLDIKPRGIKENICGVKDYENFDLPPEFNFPSTTADNFRYIDIPINNPSSRNSFGTSESPFYIWDVNSNLPPELDFAATTGQIFPDVDNLFNKTHSSNSFGSSECPFDSPPLPKRS